jgi:WD40 repeat protein
LRSTFWTVRALPSGEELLRVQNRSFAENANAFSPDGRLLALGADKGQMEVWEVDARALLFRWQPHGVKNVEFLCFTPEGDLVTVAQNDDRLTVIRMRILRERLAAMGLDW